MNQADCLVMPSHLAIPAHAALHHQSFGGGGGPTRSHDDNLSCHSADSFWNGEQPQDAAWATTTTTTNPVDLYSRSKPTNRAAENTDVLRFSLLMNQDLSSQLDSIQRESNSSTSPLRFSPSPFEQRKYQKQLQEHKTQANTTTRPGLSRKSVSLSNISPQFDDEFSFPVPKFQETPRTAMSKASSTRSLVVNSSESVLNAEKRNRQKELEKNRGRSQSNRSLQTTLESRNRSKRSLASSSKSVRSISSSSSRRNVKKSQKDMIATAAFKDCLLSCKNDTNHSDASSGSGGEKRDSMVELLNAVNSTDFVAQVQQQQQLPGFGRSVTDSVATCINAKKPKASAGASAGVAKLQRSKTESDARSTNTKRRSKGELRSSDRSKSSSRSPKRSKSSKQHHHQGAPTTRRPPSRSRTSPKRMPLTDNSSSNQSHGSTVSSRSLSSPRRRGGERGSRGSMDNSSNQSHTSRTTSMSSSSTGSMSMSNSSSAGRHRCRSPHRDMSPNNKRTGGAAAAASLRRVKSSGRDVLQRMQDLATRNVNTSSKSKKTEEATINKAPSRSKSMDNVVKRTTASASATAATGGGDHHRKNARLSVLTELEGDISKASRIWKAARTRNCCTPSYADDDDDMTMLTPVEESDKEHYRRGGNINVISKARRRLSKAMMWGSKKRILQDEQGDKYT